jgi:uncharacterized NAD-dependent epimerase/dehydratase family protein
LLAEEVRLIDAPGRSFVILAEGSFGADASKTARGVIRYSRHSTVAVIDSTQAGRTVGDVVGPLAAGTNASSPIVATLADALRLPCRPTTLLLGTAPVGGRLAGSWRDTILQALNAGLDIANGLHEFVGDDPEFAAAARRSGARIHDFRRPPERMEVATGREHLPGKRVILTVGTDCAVGKMSVALELARAAREAGLSAAMVPTGQTGMMIEGWGITIDRVAADFLQGTVEWLTEEGERRADWLVIEGQGSLDHIAYSSCTLGLLHGSRPHGMVLVHQPGRDRHVLFENAGAHATLRPLAQHIAAHESVAALVEPAPVVAVALNTSLHDEAQACRLIERTAAETGLPVDDPYRFGPTRLFDAIRSRLDAGPTARRIASDGNAPVGVAG